MSKRNKNIDALKNEKLVNRLRIFLIAALVVLIFYPPYLQGLFFEKHVLPTQIFVFILFIIFLIYKLLKKDYTFFKTPIEYISLGFVIVYFMAIFVAVHTRSAIIEWLKYCMYFAVFYMITDLADNLKTKLLFLWTIVISAVGVSIIGLDAALGGKLVGILNKFFNVIGVQGNLFFGLFVDNRIHSTLQYPNALASYLMAVFIITVGLLMVYNKWWQRIILGSFSYIIFLTFMLTQSRGMQLLFPVLIIIFLIATPKGNRIKTVIHVLLLALPAGVISLFIIPLLTEDTLKLKVLSFLLVGLFFTVFSSLIVKFVGALLEKINWKIYIAVIIAIVIASVVGINYIINQSVPIELSFENSEGNKIISITKDIYLMPDKDYILRFEAEGRMREEKPYAFFVSLFSKNINNILFDGSSFLIWNEYPETDGFEEFDILFRTKEDTKLISVSFSIYHSGTSVKINNAYIVDAGTGKTIKKIILKNKFNLDNIISRFQNIWLQKSMVSRAIFYKDGLNIFKDKWLLGAGGGAWNYLYRQYQSYNYASSQAHNYPLQLIIETGILGIIILISLVIFLIKYYAKYYKKIRCNNSSEENKLGISGINVHLCSIYITGIATLMMHSLIDFDFSESAIFLLFWQLIALYDRELIDSMSAEELKLLHIRKSHKKFTGSNKCKTVIFMGIIISAISLYYSSTFFIASSYAKQSFKYLQNNDIETAISKMERAIKLDKYNEKYIIGYNPMQNRPDIKAGLTDILFLKNEKYKMAQENGEVISDDEFYLLQKQFSKAALYIKDIENKTKNNLSLTSDLASYCFKTGQIDKGINYLDLAISYYPFESSLWQSKIDVYYQLMKEYFNNEDYERAKEYLLKGLNVIDEVKNVNKGNMNPFVFNDNTVKLLQTMKFMQDSWDTNAIFEVNDVVLYSMFALDLNMDGVPDQLGISNPVYMKVSVNNEKDLYIQTSIGEYLYTRYPIKLKKNKKYRVEILANDNVGHLSLYIPGITSEVLNLNFDGDKYSAEFLVEDEPNTSGNELRIYFKSNCVLEGILAKEIR